MKTIALFGLLATGFASPAVADTTLTFGQSEVPFPFGDDFLRHFFGNQAPQNPHHRLPQGEERGMGSGMILDRSGHILTNYHVVSDVDEINVQLADKRKFAATVVGSDRQTDVAVIKIKGKLPDDVAIVTLGDSDALQVGHLVEAIGAPFGLVQTVTTGIISATGRSDVGIADYEDFLQTDAAINPGNSGGPLVNMRGEVIGMNSAIATSSGQFAGVGFAIPSSMIKAMLPKLIKGEKIARGQLGVLVQDVTQELAKQFGLPKTEGVLVSQVNKGSPAEKAGIQPGDVIVRYQGRETKTVRELRNMVAGTLPGTKASVVIVRGGKEQTLNVAVGAQTAEKVGTTPSQANATALSKLGIHGESLTPSMAKDLGVEVSQGVAVTDVVEGSPASLAGLQKGDVIVEVDRRPVANVSDLEQGLAKAKGQLLMRLVRRGGSLFVVISV